MTERPEGHTIRVFPDHATLIDAAAAEVGERLLLARGGGRVALAGGRTPAPLYERLATHPPRPHLDRLWFTLTDERAVPPEDEESNYRMVYRTLCGPLDVPPERILRFRGEDPPEHAADKAHRDLMVWAQRVPLFDLVLLGLGADGHVASLFPSPGWPDPGARWAIAVRDPAGRSRITLTPEAIRSAHGVVFLVSGEDKANAVRATLSAEVPSPAVPARLVAGGATPALWLLDAAAASLLPEAWRAEA